MKLNITQKCQAIGSLFLLAITGIEIALFLTIFNPYTFGGIGVVAVTVIVFNISIWIFAKKYQIIKEYLERKENEHAD